MKAGDRFTIVAKVAVDAHTKTVMNADEIDEESVVAACRLRGELTVLSATVKGSAKEVRLKLSEADCENDGKPADFFKAGDVVYLRHGNPDNFAQVNGVEPDATQSELIDTFLYVHGEEDSTDDELLGAPGKVKSGETWPINRDAMVRDCVREGFSGIKAEDMKGQTTLAAITQLEGQPATRLVGKFRLDNTGLQMPSLPEGVRARRFILQVEDETELPLNPAGLAAHSKMHLTLESEADGTIEQEGQVTKVRVAMRQRCAADVVVTPIK